MNVVLVEDTKGEQLLTKVLFKRHLPETQLKICSDGQEAIEYLEANPEPLPDFILLDLNMPRMGGHEFLETYFPDKSTEKPFVIILTSSVNAEDESRVCSFKAVKGYKKKPLNDKMMSEMIHFLETIDH